MSSFEWFYRVWLHRKQNVYHIKDNALSHAVDRSFNFDFFLTNGYLVVLYTEQKCTRLRSTECFWCMAPTLIPTRNNDDCVQKSMNMVNSRTVFEVMETTKLFVLIFSIIFFKIRH